MREASVEAWRATLGAAFRHIERWNELGDKGFERLRAFYTVEAMVDAYESAITAVL